MSAYLARMAARALGQGPVVAPRTPSLFEPLPEEAGLADLSAPSIAPSAPEPAMAQPPTAIAAGPPPLHQLAAPKGMQHSVSPPPGPLAPPMPSAAAPAIQRRFDRTASDGADHAMPSLLADGAGRHAAGDPPVIQRKPMTIPATAVSAAATPALPVAAALDSQPQPVAEIALPRPLAAAPRSTSPQIAPPQEANSPAEAVPVEQATIPSAAIPPRSSRVQSPSPLRVDARPAGDRALAATATLAHHAVSAAPPPPIIEIHIGSVEIRAAAPPIVATPAPTAPASRSLDAFLAGGR